MARCSDGVQVERKMKRPPAKAGGLFADAEKSQCNRNSRTQHGNDGVQRRAVELLRHYMTTTGRASGGATRVSLATGSGRRDRNQPAESHACGMTNSDQPQSRQTRMSGEGVIGGWLRVRGLLRNSRTSAGTSETAADWHFGQVIHTPQGTRASGAPKKELREDTNVAEIVLSFQQ